MKYSVGLLPPEKGPYLVIAVSCDIAVEFEFTCLSWIDEQIFSQHFLKVRAVKYIFSHHCAFTYYLTSTKQEYY